MRSLALILASIATVIACGLPSGFAQSPEDWSSRQLELMFEPARAHPPVVTGLAVEAKGNLLATAGDDHLVRVWNRETGELLWLLNGHVDWVRTLDFSPDGAVLASAGHDGRIVIWNMNDGSRVREFSQLRGPVSKLCFSHDGEWLASTGYETSLALYRWREEVAVRVLPCPCQDMRAIAFSPNDRLIAAGGRNGKIRVWEVESGKVADEYHPHSQRVRAIDFEDDGEQIYSTGEDRAIYVAHVGSGQQGRILTTLNAKVYSMVRIDKWLITGCADNTIRVCDRISGTELATLSGHEGTVSVLAAIPGQFFSGGFDTTIREWKLTAEITAPR